MAYVLFGSEEIASTPGITILDTTVTGADLGDIDALEVAAGEMVRIIHVLRDEDDARNRRILLTALSDLAAFAASSALEV